MIVIQHIKHSICIGMYGRMSQLARGLKTLSTPVHYMGSIESRRSAISLLYLLDRVLHDTSHNKSLLYESKHNRLPSILSTDDHMRLQNVVRELLDSMELTDVKVPYSQHKHLGKLGLQLFMNCNKGHVNPTSTTLAVGFWNAYIKHPTVSGLEVIASLLSSVREYLKLHRIYLASHKEIDSLVWHAVNKNRRDAELLFEVLKKVDYNLLSNGIVRFTKSDRTTDSIETAVGWKTLFGYLHANTSYVKSLSNGQSSSPVISIDEELLVLVYDGTLRHAKSILPSLKYSEKLDKSLLIVVSKDCVGDALAAVTINNNKRKRAGLASKIVLMRYDTKTNDNLTIQENKEFLRFLRLPNGIESIYSPEFSDLVPSKITASRYYGSLESMKASNGEALLYNPPIGLDGVNSLLKTITVKVGGDNEFEILKRIGKLDNLVNDFLCKGIAQGFIPSHGIALIKSIPHVNSVFESNPRAIDKDTLLSVLELPMKRALRNMLGLQKNQVSKLVMENLDEPKFEVIKLENGWEHAAHLGALEPWVTMDTTIASVISFLRLLASCEYTITKIVEHPKNIKS